MRAIHIRAAADAVCKGESYARHFKFVVRGFLRQAGDLFGRGVFRLFVALHLAPSLLAVVRLLGVKC